MPARPSRKKPRKAKPKKRRKRRPRLPKKLVYVHCVDKENLETWHDPQPDGRPRDELNFPAPWRAVFLAKPGLRKTSTLKNVIARACPFFEKIYILHADPHAQEYADVEGEILKELPPTEFWLNGGQAPDEEDEDGMGMGEDEEPPDPADRPKTLCVLDDICFSSMNKVQKQRLDRLCGMVSTHCNVSLAVLNQDFFACPPIVRKCANIFFVWKPTDRDEIKTMARRVGYKAKELEGIFNDHCPNPTDFVLVDNTEGSPFPLRVNGYKLLKKHE